MELPPARTAPNAIRALGLTIRRGIEYARSKRAREAAAHWTNELKRVYEGSVAEEFPFAGAIAWRSGKCPLGTYDASGQSINLLDPALQEFGRIVAKPRRPARVFFPTPAEADFPPTWGARVYESIGWPPEPTELGRHRFRLFVDFKRAAYNLTIPLHDPRDPWEGRTCRMRAPYGPPFSPSLPFLSYLVIDKGMSQLSLHRWLTVYLAQRLMLTSDEETSTFEAFFAGRSRESRGARFLAYEQTKRRFHVPVAGRASFPAYLRKVVLGLEKEEKHAEPVLVGPGLVALSQLRWSEPKLYRALLDRIENGTVPVIEVDGWRCVSVADASVVESERERNAAIRTRKRFRDKRPGWIARLIARGETQGSALRKVQRWINTDLLSEEDVEASVAAGHRVRLPRSDQRPETS